MLLVLERKKSIGTSVPITRGKLVVVFSLFATGKHPACYWCLSGRKRLETRDCLLPVCYRPASSMLLVLQFSHMENSSLFFPACCRVGASMLLKLRFSIQHATGFSL